jgi:phosphate butyryltransferase
LGIEKPNIAVICATETVNPKISATVDARRLQDMNDEGLIENCRVVGPISLDLAVSRASAAHKGFDHPAAGKADLLLAPNIESANIFYKTLTCFCDFKTAGLTAGARVPVIMTSRADSPRTKLNTIAVAAYLAGGAA